MFILWSSLKRSYLIKQDLTPLNNTFEKVNLTDEAIENTGTFILHVVSCHSSLFNRQMFHLEEKQNNIDPCQLIMFDDCYNWPVFDVKILPLASDFFYSLHGSH